PTQQRPPEVAASRSSRFANRPPKLAVGEPTKELVGGQPTIPNRPPKLAVGEPTRSGALGGHLGAPLARRSAKRGRRKRMPPLGGTWVHRSPEAAVGGPRSARRAASGSALRGTSRPWRGSRTSRRSVRSPPR